MGLKISTWTRRLLRRPDPQQEVSQPGLGSSAGSVVGSALEGVGDAAEGAVDVSAEASDFMLVGQDTALGGRLVMDRSIRVEGEFRGSIECSETVVVAPSGSVEGDIRARRVVILGAVVGNVTGRREVSLRALGRLHGEVVTANFELERGAFFIGHTRMLRPQDRGWRRADATPAA
jgi:cytoskeletal protein CcmA (bactofilin family)